MGIIEAIKNGFVSIWKNIKLWFLMVVISIILFAIAIPIVIVTFGPAVMQMGGTANLTPDQLSSLNINWLLVGIFMVLMLLAQTFVNAGVLGSVKELIKSNALKLGNFLGYAKKFFGRLVLFSLIIAAAMFILMLLAILVFGMIGALGKANLTMGIILGIGAGIISMFLLIIVGMYGSLVPIVIASEDKGLGQSLALPIKFIKEKFWATMGMCVLLWLLIIIIGIINRVFSNLGPISAIVGQVIVSLANIYISLVYVSSFMHFYMGNTAVTAPVKEK